MTDSAAILYFHGLPGSADELHLFGRHAARKAADFHVVDRTPVARREGQAADRPFAALAARIQQQFGARPLHFIGFSLGASAALRTAACLGDQVLTLRLISAAAPLNLGDYLSDMAGAPIFRLAQSSPMLFAALARLQSLTARIAPETLYLRLFATAAGADRALAADPAFKAAMLRLLRDSLGPGLATYRDEIGHYTTPWAPDLADIRQPVTLDHGSADNWTPVPMAHDLAARLPNVTAVRVHEGLSHYSTLRAFLTGASSAKIGSATTAIY